jgi:hypothetical protein
MLGHYPQIRFKVISNTKKLNEFSLAANQRDEQFFQLKYNTFWIQYVPFPLKIDDEFNLFGKKAQEVYTNYIINTPEDDRILKTTYYGIPLTEPDGFVINDDLPPSGALDKPYYFQITSKNGRNPITWSVPYGLLPIGLNIEPETGIIYGVPDKAEGSEFYLEAQDGNYPPNTDLKPFFISIYQNQIETVTYEFQSTNIPVAMPGAIIGTSLTGIKLTYTTNYDQSEKSQTIVTFNDQIIMFLTHNSVYNGQTGLLNYNGTIYTITFGINNVFTMPVTTTPNITSTTTTTTSIPTSTTTSTTPRILTTTTTTTTTTTPFPYCIIPDNLPMPGSSITLDGTVLIGSGTGAILNYNSYYSCCESLIQSSSSPIWLGAIVRGITVFNYTVSFSKLVNNILIVIAGSNAGESFTITPGSGTINLINLRSCGYSITGNTATAVLEYAGGAGIYMMVNHASGFNTLNISGPGAGGGSVVSICMNGN